MLPGHVNVFLYVQIYLEEVDEQLGGSVQLQLASASMTLDVPWNKHNTAHTYR